VKSDYLKNLSQIGGRWAISLRTGMAIFPIFVLSIPILEANFRNSREFLEWTWVSLLASIPTGLFLYLAHLTYFRNRIVQPKPPTAVFILGFLVGAIKGSLVEIFALRYGLTSGHEVERIAIRTLNSAILSSITIPLIALTLVTAHNFRVQKRDLLEQLAFLLSKNAQISKFNSGEQEVSPEQLRLQINGLLSQTKKAFAEERAKVVPSASKLVKILRDTAEDVIRPLSHTLYEKSLVNLPAVNPFQTFKALSIHFQIELPLIVSAYIIFSFKNLYVLYGFKESLVLISWRSVLLMSTLWCIRELVSMPKIKLINPFITASFLGTIFFVSIESLISHRLGYATDPAKIMLSIIWNLIIVIISGLLTAITDFNRFQLDTLKLQISKEEEVAHSKALQQRFLYRSHSKILHGVYHSRLIACAVAISTAEKIQDKDGMAEELDRAESLLEIDFETHMAKIHQNPDSILKELKEKWAGSLDIHFEFEELNSISEYQLLAMNEFLSESLTNAFRHGRANWASINFRLNSQNQLLISITDDGVGYIPSHPGLGSAIFDELSNGSWEIRSRTDSNGTIVSIVIQPEELK
jgi:two-component sensor histidine kinase